MLKLISINRKVIAEGPHPKVSDESCDVVIVIGECRNKGHFHLTEQEAVNFDKLATEVEARIASDIAASDNAGPAPGTSQEA